MKTTKRFYVMFADLADYSTKNIYEQKKLVKKFMKHIKNELKRFKKNTKIIKSPAGDGIMIIIPTKITCKTKKKTKKIDSLPLKITRNLIVKRKKYKLRIGLSYGEGLIYKDIKGKNNFVGSTINNCSRIMNSADKNQILISDSYYHLLKEKGIKSYKKFKKYQVRVKHNLVLDIYQYKSQS